MSKPKAAKKSPVVSEAEEAIATADKVFEGVVAAVMVPMPSLKPWLKNPRKIPKEAIERVAASIKRFGFASPVIAQKSTGEIIAGHTRLLAAQSLGITDVPVRYMDLSDAEAHALAIADNKLPELTSWDDVLLAELLKEIPVDDALGFSELELKALLSPTGLPPLDEQIPDKPKKPVSKIGDMYTMGDHRLACGDCRTSAYWDGVKADLVWTDPPYGVAIVGGTHAKPAEARKAAGNRIIENDALDEPALEELLRGAFAIAIGHTKPGAVFYVAAPAGPLFHIFGTVLKEHGIWRHTLNWVKSAFVMGRCDYHYRHEPLFYGWKPDGGHYWAGARNLDTCLEFDRPKNTGESPLTKHPTTKPVELVQLCIENSSRRGELVIDPFLGSGTTLIAGHRLNRRVIGTELDLGYCDVIVERWRALTNGKVTLVSGSPSLKGKAKR